MEVEIDDNDNSKLYILEDDEDYKLSDVLKELFGDIYHSLNQEQYNIRSEEFYFLKEIKYGDKTVGFASLVNIFNDYILNDFFILPEYRGKKLFHDFLVYAFKKYRKLSIYKPNRDVVDLLIKYEFAYNLTEDVCISYILFLTDLDELKNKDEKILSPFTSLYDLDACCLVYIEKDRKANIHYNVSLPLIDDEKYDPVAKDISEYESIANIIYDPDSGIPDAMGELKLQELVDTCTLEEAVGKGDEIGGYIKELVDEEYLTEEEAHDLKGMLQRAYDKGKIEDNGIKAYIDYYVFAYDYLDLDYEIDSVIYSLKRNQYFCPNCRSRNYNNDSFCRVCGFSTKYVIDHVNGVKELLKLTEEYLARDIDEFNHFDSEVYELVGDIYVDKNKGDKLEEFFKSQEDLSKYMSMDVGKVSLEYSSGEIPDDYDFDGDLRLIMSFLIFVNRYETINANLLDEIAIPYGFLGKDIYEVFHEEGFFTDKIDAENWSTQSLNLNRETLNAILESNNIKSKGSKKKLLKLINKKLNIDDLDGSFYIINPDSYLTNDPSFLVDIPFSVKLDKFYRCEFLDFIDGSELEDVVKNDVNNTFIEFLNHVYDIAYGRKDYNALKTILATRGDVYNLMDKFYLAIKDYVKLFILTLNIIFLDEKYYPYTKQYSPEFKEFLSEHSNHLELSMFERAFDEVSSDIDTWIVPKSDILNILKGIVKGEPVDDLINNISKEYYNKENMNPLIPFSDASEDIKGLMEVITKNKISNFYDE